MATATNVRVLRSEETGGQVFYRVRVYQFSLDIGSVATNSIDVSTATLPGVDPTKDFVLGVQHTDDIAHAVIHEFHIGGVDTMHILTHNNSGGPVDPAPMVVRVIVARLRL